MPLVGFRSLRASRIFKSLGGAPSPVLQRNLFEQRVYKAPKKAFYDASAIAMAKDKQWKTVRADRSKRRKLDSGSLPIVEGTPDEILEIEVAQLIAKNQKPVSENSGNETGDQRYSDNGRAQTEVNSSDPSSLVGPAREVQMSESHQPVHGEIELKVLELSSTGDGLALSESGTHVYVVSFVTPGDRVLARTYSQRRKGDYSHVDLVKVLEPSEIRDDSLVRCKYFAKCGGCQFQMLPYEAQLAHKKTIVEKAFRYFSGLNLHQIPTVGDTIGSPMRYGYRTKLTPHFDGHPRRKEGQFTEVPPIGFIEKGRSRTIDIESCPIGTEILQEGLIKERAKVAKTYRALKMGATILLRESTERTSNVEAASSRAVVASTDDAKRDPETGEIIDDSFTKELTTTESGEPLLVVKTPTHIDSKTCVTDNNAMSTEYISSFKFTSRAGSFFQNNNSILPRFTSYVREHALPPILNPSDPPIKYLLDAYCGSGLFAVTLSSLFTSALGIDIDPKGVEAARLNAEQNSIPNAGFIEADAAALFADVPYPPAQTLVVIDPPRKGASEDFLRQLMRFGPKRVVYVSCNVHTQARDIGMLVNGIKGSTGSKYELESLRGFDFFPQTGHVEGVAFLNRVESLI